MIDVGRKVVAHQVKGFLGAQTVYFLLNFNLAHRQIWITRHVSLNSFSSVFIFCAEWVYRGPHSQAGTVAPIDNL